ncbi:hypothetical protein BDW66DRAFT_70529 [Aspergillus desertorum]
MVAFNRIKSSSFLVSPRFPFNQGLRGLFSFFASLLLPYPLFCGLRMVGIVAGWPCGFFKPLVLPRIRNCCPLYNSIPHSTLCTTFPPVTTIVGVSANIL